MPPVKKAACGSIDVSSPSLLTQAMVTIVMIKKTLDLSKRLAGLVINRGVTNHIREDKGSVMIPQNSIECTDSVSLDAWALSLSDNVWR